MPRESNSEFFWNAPHAFENARAVDPLGFDALREAMSNVMVPFLTGATRHAEHYVAVVAGLRWAKSSALRPIDQDIWPLFARFERGLKQYWHLYPHGRAARGHYLGKRKIKEICGGERPNVDAPILQDQRGIGLLGNYIESLRAIGLIRPGQIQINERAAAQLLGDPRFIWNGKSPPTWKALEAVFSTVDMPAAWPRVGHALFDIGESADERVHMYSAARAAYMRPQALSWMEIGSAKSLLATQRLIATATGPVAQMEEGLRMMFAVLLKGKVLPPNAFAKKTISALARRLLALNVVGTAWAQESPLAKILQQQIESLVNGQLSSQTLLAWHLDIAKTRGTEPWIRDLGERSALELTAHRTDPDFRFTNLRTLLRETKWRPERPRERKG